MGELSPYFGKGQTLLFPYTQFSLSVPHVFSSPSISSLQSVYCPYLSVFILTHLAMVVARSSFARIAKCYVFPVLWMPSCFHTTTTTLVMGCSALANSNQ